MLTFIFLLIIVFYIVLAALWTWYFLLRPFIKYGYQATAWAWHSAQLSVFLAVFLTWYTSSLFTAVTVALFPPSLLLMLPRVSEFSVFLALPTFCALAAALAVGYLSFRFKLLQSFSSATGLIVGAVFFFLVSEQLSKSAMCDAASLMGTGTFKRHSFAWSAVNSGNKFQFEIHAILENSEGKFGWSYRDRDFFLLNDKTEGNVSTGESFQCRG